MTNEQEQAHRDEWQTALYEASYRYSVALRNLSDTNPWPERPAIGQAINTLATELWDRCFGMSEITIAFQQAITDLPRYTANEEVRL